jgi:hypothetical protein
VAIRLGLIREIVVIAIETVRGDTMRSALTTLRGGACRSVPAAFKASGLDRSRH